MAGRVTVDEVRVIITTGKTDPEVQSYIDIANPMVTATVTCGLSAAVLKEIERWLTAHLLSLTDDRQAKKEKVGLAEITYVGEFGAGLQSTTYGQMVLTLDTCGSFGKLGKTALSIKAITSFS